MLIELVVRWNSDGENATDIINRLQQRLQSRESVGKLVINSRIEMVLQETGAENIIADLLDIAHTEDKLPISDYYKTTVVKYMRQRILSFLSYGWPSLRREYLADLFGDLELSISSRNEVYDYTINAEKKLDEAYQFLLSVVGLFNFIDTVIDKEGLRFEIIRREEEFADF